MYKDYIELLLQKKRFQNVVSPGMKLGRLKNERRSYGRVSGLDFKEGKIGVGRGWESE